MSRRNNSVKPEVKVEEPVHQTDQHELPDGEVQLHSGAETDATQTAVSVHVLKADGTDELPAGSLLVICTDPGFKRAGIEHERLKVYADGDLTPRQIAQMRREPKLTLVEVG